MTSIIVAVAVAALIAPCFSADARDVALPKVARSHAAVEIRCGEPAWVPVRRAIDRWCERAGCSECAWLRTAVRTCDRGAGLYEPDEQTRQPIVARPEGSGGLGLSFATGGAEGDRAVSVHLVRATKLGWRVESGTCEEYRL